VLGFFLAFAPVISLYSEDAVIENCEISGNTATGKGGGLYLKTNDAKVINSTVVNNESLEDSGGGIAFEAGYNPYVCNTIFWNNMAPEAKEILFPSAYIMYSDIEQDGFAGSNGNINRNPLFISTNDLRLQSLSPLIGKGGGSNVPVFDKNGSFRGTQSDIGAYEYGITARTFYVDGTNGDDAYNGVVDTYNSTTGDGPKKTIQAALNAAASGDIINVGTGTYTGDGNKNLDFKGKNIQLIGSSVAGVIIDCQNSGRAFYFHCNETSDATVEKFTIKNGLVTGNFPEGCGGAILISDSSPTIKNCIITDNSASWGGGIELNNSGSRIENCQITGNTAEEAAGGVYILGDSDIDIVNCTIADNTETNGDSSSISNPSLAVNIVNSIIERLHILEKCPDNVTVSYSCVEDGFTGTGNISWDSSSTSMFIGDGDYHPHPFSSAIDQANSDLAPATDLEGNSRQDISYSDDGTEAGSPPTDIGAYELTSSQDLSGLTQRNLTLATDETTSISYTVTNGITSSTAASGSVDSSANSSHNLPEGYYEISYSISSVNYVRTVHLTSDVTIYLNTNEKEFDLGEVSTYKRYEFKVNYNPFGVTDTHLVYEDEIADIYKDKVYLYKSDATNRTVDLRAQTNSELQSVECLSIVYTPSAYSDLVCSGLPVKNLSLPDNTIIVDLNYNCSAAVIATTELSGESSAQELDTYERYKVSVNHLQTGETDEFYVKENSGVEFSVSEVKAYITPDSGSGVSNWTQDLTATTEAELTSFSDPSFTANNSKADDENIIPVTANYQAEAAVSVPMTSDCTSGYGGGDPDQMDDTSYAGKGLDTYKRYLVKVKYSNLGETTYDSFYVIEDDTINFSVGEATITREETVLSPAITLENFPENMDFVSFSPSSTVEAEDSNAVNGIITVTTGVQAEAAVSIPVTSECSSGYGGGDPAKLSDSSYTGNGLDTYQRYNVDISYNITSQTNSFYVVEGDEITLTRGTATVTGSYPATVTLLDFENQDFSGFTPAGPVTANDTSADTDNKIAITGDYTIMAAVSVSSDIAFSSGYGGADPAASATNYQGGALDTFKRYKVTVDYSNLESSSADEFYVNEQDVITLQEGSATIASDVNPRTETLQTFDNLDFIGFTPSGPITASDDLANPQNSIIVSAWQASASVAVSASISFDTGYGGGDPEATGDTPTSTGGTALDTRKRYKIDIAYKNHVVDKTESFYAMEDDSATITSSSATVTGINPVTKTLTYNSLWTINSFTFDGVTDSPSISFDIEDENSDPSNLMTVYANYSLSATSTEFVLPVSSESDYGYGGSNETDGEDYSLHTWKRFVYDLEAEPMTYYNNVVKIKLQWQNKVVTESGYDKVEQIIVKTNVAGDFGTVTFPNRVSTGQELDGNAVVVHVGDIVSGGYNYILDSLPGDDSVYKYRIYTRLTDSEKPTVILWEDEASFTTSELSLFLDSDNDGLTDSYEANHGMDSNSSDSDNDGISDYDEVEIYGTNPLDSDTDGDDISDYDEIFTYFTDPNDADSDNDWVSDGDEINIYLSDPLDTDSDNDGIEDGYEVYYYSTNPSNTDSDGDGIGDYDEIYTYFTDPTNTDSDGDGLTDAEELLTYNSNPLDNDCDDDGLSDGDEVNTYNTDPLDSDSDDDGLSDGDEVNTYSTDPNDADSDGDGVNDGDEVNTYNTDPNDTDSDDDGIPDAWEIQYNLDPNDDSDASTDTDSDGLTALQEYTNNSNPASADTDGDGINDGTEVTNGTDPGNRDSDGDGLDDNIDSSPNSNTDTDSDNLPDDWENYYFGNLTQIDTGDPDSDSMDNYGEYLLGRHPNAGAVNDSTDSLELKVFNP
jgi:hypothetical protein